MELQKIVNDVGRELTTLNSEPHRKFKLALDNEERMYVELFESGNLCLTMERVDITTKLNELILKTSSVINFKIKEDDAISQAVLMVSELATYFPNAKMNEVETAFNTGVRGMYGEFMGLSVVTYHKWLTSYFESEKRKIAIKRYLDMKEAEQNIEPTDAEKEKIFADAYASDIEKIKNGIEVSPTHVMYDYCEKNKFIELDIDSKRDLAANVKANIESLINSSDRDYVKYLKLILEDKLLFGQECKKEAYINHLKNKFAN